MDHEENREQVVEVKNREHVAEVDNSSEQVVEGIQDLVISPIIFRSRRTRVKAQEL